MNHQGKRPDQVEFSLNNVLWCIALSIGFIILILLTSCASQKNYPKDWPEHKATKPTHKR
jgi:hypothetical protein